MARSVLLPLVSRDPSEAHRASTPLELLFDLCFVVAVAQAGGGLHHALADGHVRDALVGYSTVFFAIWWAWVNFSWFASSYDNDDLVYRIGAFVQIGGVLILAAGVPRAFTGSDFAVVTIGYLVMRTALVAGWLRAARDDPAHRPTNLRYAVGVAICQLGWVALMFLPDSARMPGFVVMVVAEMSVPVWAERATPNSWHPHHIAERYSLFTIIVLGETILAATVAVQTALDSGSRLDDVAEVAIAGLVSVCSMWWLYFDRSTADHVADLRNRWDSTTTAGAFVWGYGHYFVLSGAAAVGAGLAVAVDHATGESTISSSFAALSVAVPAAVYLVAVTVLHAPLRWTMPGTTAICAAVLMVALAVMGAPVITTALLLAATAAQIPKSAARSASTSASSPSSST